MTSRPSRRARPYPAPFGAVRALWVAALLVLAACAPPPVPDAPRTDGAAAIRMASYNVHFVDLRDAPNPHWTPERWHERRGALVQVVRGLDADLIALQELEGHDDRRSRPDLRLDWILEAMPGYRVAAAEFAGGVTPGQPILYRDAAFALLDAGFAFYDDPDASLQSLRAFAGYPDVVTWARLRHRESGRRLTVFNVHLHFLDAGQRLRSAQQVIALAQAAQARGDAVFVLGDFNARRNSRTLDLFREAGYRQAGPRGATFHLNTGLHLFGAIDHMLHDARSAPLGPVAIVRRRPGGVWPSDHYPVVTDFRLTAQAP
ncbi:MAG: endonuclease/exonuclease/phosphatase family protein [Roseovarius sp.]|nr:endonuclease/exonuclease/phosphatase family protein [Roseovarius sp.]